jgi:hypothetical protein
MLLLSDVRKRKRNIHREIINRRTDKELRLTMLSDVRKRKRNTHTENINRRTDKELRMTMSGKERETYIDNIYKQTESVDALM